MTLAIQMEHTQIFIQVGFIEYTWVKDYGTG
jgi:hypothetical protein